MLPLTNNIKEQLKIRIKNKIDISDLVENIDLKDQDLSWGIISKFRRIDTNLSGCNFSHCILGNNTDIFTLIRCNISNCNFDSANFIGKAWIRSCNAKNCNFKNADVSNVSYEYTDFSNTTFCCAKIRLDSRTNVGCTFDRELIVELIKNWTNKLEIK